MAIDIDRLNERLATLGKSAMGASIEAGLKKDAVRNIQRGKSRQARTDTIIRLANVLQCDVAYLMGDDGGRISPELSGARPDLPRMGWLEVLFEIGAGYRVDARQQIVGEYGPVAESEKYRGRKQWLERVIGNAATKQFQPGDLVHVVDLDGSRYIPVTGDRVVLRRCFGDMVERSIRRVSVSASGVATLVNVGDADAGGAEEYPHASDHTASVVGKIIGRYSSVE